MTAADRLLAAFLSDEDGFRAALKSIIKKDLRMNVREFSRRAGISQSTLYKLISEGREPNLRTVRAVFRAINELEEKPERGFIGIIAARPVIEKIVERRLTLDGEKIVVREYSASTVEDAIVAAVSAERDGASAVVCAPIIGTTVEKIVKIPVITIMPESSVVKAIKVAAKKARMK